MLAASARLLIILLCAAYQVNMKFYLIETYDSPMKQKPSAVAAIPPMAKVVQETGIMVMLDFQYTN